MSVFLSDLEAEGFVRRCRLLLGLCSGDAVGLRLLVEAHGQVVPIHRLDAHGQGWWRSDEKAAAFRRVRVRVSRIRRGFRDLGLNASSLNYVNCAGYTLSQPTGAALMARLRGERLEQAA